MNSKLAGFIKNFSYTLTSNFISLAVSSLVVLIVPKLIGVEEYGNWQLYLFYSAYVGFLQFGWSDGIYLVYGGKEYAELDKRMFFSQFYMLVILQILNMIIIKALSIHFVLDANRNFIIQMTALCMFITNIRGMLLLILQGTNRIKEYAQITMTDRILYCLLIVVLLIAGIRDYKLMVVADLAGRFVSLLIAVYHCKDIVMHRISSFYFTFREAWNNINVGIKLMFSNIASILIIGVVRFGIERSWDVATFGRVSFTLSISNLLMLFVNAVGLIMLPVLRRTDKKKLPDIYEIIRNFLMVLLLGVLLVYYPAKAILSVWLPQYAESLKYMALLFPMCIYEGKVALLINTYLKTLRKEKLILKINLISLALSVILTFITVYVFNNLNLAVTSILVLLAFRCILAEICLSDILKIRVSKDIILEVAMVLIFMLSGWILNIWFGIAVYVAAYAIYLFMKKRDIKYTIKTLKQLLYLSH